MATGIYHLQFKNGDTYVGQAKDISKRWEQHYNDLRKNKHTKALQLAYHHSHYALPDTSILLECHPDYLDHYESYWIHELKPTLNHQIPQPLTEHQLQWFCALANSNQTHHGISVLIEEVHTGNLAKLEVGQLRDTLDDKVAVEALALEGHHEALEEIETLGDILRGTREELLKLQQFRDRVEACGWWGRLWRAW